MSIDEIYTAQIPKITGAAITPNPVIINGRAVLSVLVSDETVILYPEVFYAGEIQTGEV